MRLRNPDQTYLDERKQAHSRGHDVSCVVRRLARPKKKRMMIGGSRGGKGLVLKCEMFDLTAKAEMFEQQP